MLTPEYCSYDCPHVFQVLELLCELVRSLASSSTFQSTPGKNFSHSAAVTSYGLSPHMSIEIGSLMPADQKVILF